jgi:hypothetical protein
MQRDGKATFASQFTQHSSLFATTTPANKSIYRLTTVQEHGMLVDTESYAYTTRVDEEGGAAKVVPGEQHNVEQ